MSSNDDPGKPDVAGGSGVAANTKDNELRVILSVPNLSRPNVEPLSVAASEGPTDLTAASALPNDRPAETPQQESFAKQALAKTALLGKMFTENKRTFATLGTIAAAILICTLVARAMKQDHSAAGSLPELAFREPPATKEVEAEPSEPAAIVEATPDFDPATLLSREDRQATPTIKSTQWQPVKSRPFAPMNFEQDLTQPAALASAGNDIPEVPRETAAIAMRDTPNSLVSDPANLQLPDVNPPARSDRTTAGSRWSEHSHNGYQANFSQPPSQDLPTIAAPPSWPVPGATATYDPSRTHGQTMPPAGQGTQAAPVNPAEVWPQFEQERHSSREARESGGYSAVLEQSTAIPSPSSSWPAGHVAAQPQVEPSYPSTSKTAYPSFQDYRASLHQRRIQRERQPRFGDRHAPSQNGLGTSVPNEFSGEVR